MRDLCDALLCIPVLLFWLGPVLFVLLCGAKGGCDCLSRFLRTHVMKKG